MTDDDSNISIKRTISKSGRGHIVEIQVKFLVPSQKKSKAKLASRAIREAITDITLDLEIENANPKNICEWCDEAIDQGGRGRPRRFCSNSCRQKEYKNRRKNV